ncbi:hypothetical protein KI387_041268, partial [Taxus chinensis]
MEKKQPIEESTMQIEEGEIVELEPKKKEKSDSHGVEEKLKVEAQLPKDKEDIHDSGKTHEVVPYMSQQSASTNSHKDNRRYEDNSDLLLSIMPFQIYSHGQFVKKDDLVASLMLHNKSHQMGDSHGTKKGEKSELQGDNGAKMSGDLVKRHAHEMRVSLDAHDNFQLAGLFQTAVTKEQIDGGIHKEQSQFRHHPKK